MTSEGAADAAGKRKRIAITGAAGTVGSALRRCLRERYDFRLIDVKPVTDAVPGDQVVTGDAAHFETVLEATAGVDAIVHLALAPSPRGVTQAQRARQTFEVDMRATYNVLEAARVNGASSVVYASTNHVTGLNEQEGIISRPERFYADRMGVRFYAIRIANFNGKDEPGRDYEPGMSRWLSPRDLAQLVWRCIEAEHIPFGIYYGISKGGEKKWDISNAREQLGYDPQDDGSLPTYRLRYRS
jgi:uronate dehydrogenase